jgi:sugar O-acyltransferase (sialic acid O-acetyltransferase NeuD family)
VNLAPVDKPKLIIIGSSGHASVLTDAIELVDAFAIAGYLDDTRDPGSMRGCYPILGALRDAAAICAKQRIQHAVIAVGDNWSRQNLHSELARNCPEMRFPVVRHPSAVIARSAQIGDGAALLAFSHVGPGSRIGAFCIVNTRSLLDHDCSLGDYASLAPGVSAGGFVTIGQCSAVGVGAAISDRISIGSHTVIGTGAVIVRDIPDLSVAYGNPARVKRQRTEGEKYLKP